MGKTSYLNFTKKTLEKLPAVEKRYNVFDEVVSGLGVAVHPSGTKTFFYLKKVQGWPERTTIGPFPDITVERARGRASEMNGKLSTWKSHGYAGQNPLEQRTKVPTLGGVLDHYCEQHLRANAKNGDAAIKYAQWQFNFYLASWKNRPLSSISRQQVREKHAEIGTAHGMVTANRITTFLRTLFNHAIHPDVSLWDGANPCAKPKKFLFLEKSRERVIQRDEAPRFFEQLQKESHRDLRDFLLLALATGARRGTVLAMRWEQVDWQRGLWTIPEPKGRKSSSKPHIVPLTKLAISVLRTRVNGGGEWVFPGRKGHVTTLKKPWARFLERTGLDDLRFHDLRRSLATFEGETGAATELIQKTLGHQQASAATKIYDRSDRRDDVRNAMDAAMRELLSAGKTSKRKLLAAPRG